MYVHSRQIALEQSVMTTPCQLFRTVEREFVLQSPPDHGIGSIFGLVLTFHHNLVRHYLPRLFSASHYSYLLRNFMACPVSYKQHNNYTDLFAVLSRRHGEY